MHPSDQPSDAPRSADVSLDDDLLKPPLHPHAGLARAALLSLGTLLVIAGVILTILPVVPGFPLTIAGLLMISGSSRTMRGLINAAERRLPVGIRRIVRKTMRPIMRRWDKS
ncbi:MAG: hypothetical protein ACO3QC_11455 [Phycisphaerales bacterium]